MWKDRLSFQKRLSDVMIISKKSIQVNLEFHGRCFELDLPKNKQTNEKILAA